MLRLPVNDASAVAAAAQIILHGGVAAIPTETVYGLAVLWESQPAREKIYALKRRPAEKRLQMLAPSLDAAYTAGLLPNEALARIGARFWPGPLTVVAKSAVQGGIGLRIPAHPFVLALLKALGRPLACTSANLSGCPAGTNAHDAIAELDGAPDILVDGGAVETTGGQASTVLSLMADAPSILRQGPITLDQIRAAFI